MELSLNPKSVLNSDVRQLEATRLSHGSSVGDFKISVIVVANELLFRLGLARLLSEDDRLDVIGVSDGEPELLEFCKTTSVDVIVMDIQLSRTDGIELVRSIASECPSTQTLILMSTADWRVRLAMIAGAAGILLKDTSPQAIRAAVVSVHLGDQVLCNEAARWVLGEEPSTHLTHRELDVLHMVAQGANNAEIAAQLQLGQKTVRNYVSRLYHKLALSNRAQIATYLVNTDVETTASGTDLTLAENESLVQGQ
jgi:two-component system, NarL family, response regulator LiaR